MWDLHVHTPASVVHNYGDGQQDEVWSKFISQLAALPPSIRVLGITDYYSIDGYRKVRDAKIAGQLPNIELVIPIVELRLTSFAGNAELKKVNYHVLFADDVPPDQIEEFFLRNLNVSLYLGGGRPWNGCLGTKAGLQDLGVAVRNVTPEDKRTPESTLRVGFGSAAVPIEVIDTALAASVFEGKTLTAIGLGEWMQMRWEGAGAAQKRDAVERVDFVLTASPSVEKYSHQLDQLRANEVNARLFHASDAHNYADAANANRLGSGRCWVKADLTFEGLRRAITRFEERVYVGDLPPKLDHVRRNATKYINSIEIKKNEGSPLKEKWFESVQVPINHDLVAIIGNQGGGKSALTDAIALSGASAASDFSFLNPDRFCDKQNRAAHFTARLHWEDGQQVSIRLDAKIDPSAIERVRYVPQGFFDSVTNEPTVAEGGKFYQEITKAVFSHVEQKKRLGSNSFQELVGLRTSAIEQGVTQLRQQMSALNARIVTLEETCALPAIETLRNGIRQQEEAILSLRASPPEAVEAPPVATEAELAIQQVRAVETALREEIAKAHTAHAALLAQQVAVTNALTALRTTERQAKGDIEKIGRSLVSVGLAVDLSHVLAMNLDTTALDTESARISTAIQFQEALFDEANDNSLTARLAAVEADRIARSNALEAAAGSYQAYLTRRSSWEQQIVRLEGEEDTPLVTSLKSLKGRLHDLTVVLPQELAIARAERLQLCESIHQSIASQATVFEDITRPVQEHIAGNPLTRDRYRVAFDVVLTENGLIERFASCVKNASGTFAGVQAGKERLRALIAAADFSSSTGTVSFAETLLDNLARNHLTDPPSPVEIRSLLKKAVELRDVYDLIFSLDYLAPSFSLALNGKPLRKLSPGERGILLLVFYLLVDLGDEPLIIDQPEGNLNNQSIVDNLVPVFVAAKKRRQCIIVTHNPNLAVVCDAEQIVHCSINPNEGNLVTYESGALENPKFNKLSLDLLEGTARAFSSRRVTYEDAETLPRLA